MRAQTINLSSQESNQSLFSTSFGDFCWQCGPKVLHIWEYELTKPSTFMALMLLAMTKTLHAEQLPGLSGEGNVHCLSHQAAHKQLRTIHHLNVNKASPSVLLSNQMLVACSATTSFPLQLLELFRIMKAARELNSSHARSHNWASLLMIVLAPSSETLSPFVTRLQSHT